MNYDYDMSCPACGQEVLDIDVKCGNCGHALSSSGAQRMIGGVVLGQYEITDVLGQGGMSVVYKGKHKMTGQEVALKVLPPELAAYRDVKGRFLEEGRALAQLDHPNIVHLYNFGDDDGCLVLAMQYVRGITWERAILEQERLPWKRSTQLAIDVSNALDYAHGRGIIHRDMKPSNVLIRELDGAGTVMDFGIAKMQSSAKLTATGQTMGTVRYMSPEQVRGQEVGVQTDIYSLAMTLYESLVGDTPFDGDTHFEIMSKHLNEAPLPPSKHGIDLPPALEAALMRAMSKRPEERQRSAKEFKEDLERGMDGTGRPTDEIPRAIPPSQDRSQELALDDTAAVSSLSSKTKPLTPAALAEARGDEGAPSDDINTLIPSTRKGSRGLLAAGIGVAVAVAGGVTYMLTIGGGSGAEEPAARPAVAEADAAAAANPLDRAFLLPGASFAVDERYEDEQLRILSVKEVDPELYRGIVLDLRKEYRATAVERGWKSEVEPLTLVLSTSAQLCNPQLYKDRKVAPDCASKEAWYRYREHTLYLVPPDKEKELRRTLRFWVAASTCTHDRDSTCNDEIMELFDK